MKTYKITTAHATFGVGMVLKLSEKQSSIRGHALIKKGKNTFEIKEPIQFKQGETVSVVKGTLSRFLEDRLIDLGKKKETPPPEPKTTQPPEQPQNPPVDTNAEDQGDEKNADEPEFPKLEHVRFGQYKVFDKDGKQVNQELLKKEEAELLLEELQDEETESGV